VSVPHLGLGFFEIVVTACSQEAPTRAVTHVSGSVV
jgi:hypothetical protein